MIIAKLFGAISGIPMLIKTFSTFLKKVLAKVLLN
jgi:hypothetical protein